MDRCAGGGVEGARGNCGAAFDHEELVSRLLINWHAAKREHTHPPHMRAQSPTQSIRCGAQGEHTWEG
eukprot:6902403-Prymnesium_polylepis.1